MVRTPKADLFPLRTTSWMLVLIASCIVCLPILVNHEILGFVNAKEVFPTQFCVISAFPQSAAPIYQLYKRNGCTNIWLTAALAEAPATDQI
jgi:hypothetical protein